MPTPPTSYVWRFVYDSEALEHARLFLTPSVLISLIRVHIIPPIILGNIFASCASNGVAETFRSLITGLSKPSHRRSRQKQYLNSSDATEPSSAIDTLYHACTRTGFHLYGLFLGRGWLYGRVKEFIHYHGRRVMVTLFYQLIMAVIFYYIPALTVHYFLSEYLSPESEDPELHLTFYKHTKPLLSAGYLGFGFAMWMWSSPTGGASKKPLKAPAPYGFIPVVSLLFICQPTLSQILSTMTSLLRQPVRLFVNGTENTGTVTALGQRGPRRPRRAKAFAAEIRRGLRDQRRSSKNITADLE